MRGDICMVVNPFYCLLKNQRFFDRMHPYFKLHRKYKRSLQTCGFSLVIAGVDYFSISRIVRYAMPNFFNSAPMCIGFIPGIVFMLVSRELTKIRVYLFIVSYTIHTQALTVIEFETIFLIFDGRSTCNR